MQKKSNTLVTPRKSPRLAEETVEIEPPSFQILTQTPTKNKSPDKERRNTMKKPQSRVQKGKQKAGTPIKNQRTTDSANQNSKKRKSKTVSSSDSPYEPEEESDSDFVEQPQPKKSKSVSKGESSKSKKAKPVAKAKGRYSHWASYINTRIFNDIKERLNDEQYNEFLATPFGYFKDMPFIKVQPQLIRSLLHVETTNDRDDLFIINMNGTELRFGINEFAAITGLKCGVHSDFVSDPSVPNKLLQRYFPEKSRVTKAEFYEAFRAKDFIKQEDIVKMAIIFFISSFLLGTEPTKSHINKKYIDLVESGHYVNYPWGEDCFRKFLKNYSTLPIPQSYAQGMLEEEINTNSLLIQIHTDPNIISYAH